MCGPHVVRIGYAEWCWKGPGMWFWMSICPLQNIPIFLSQNAFLLLSNIKPQSFSSYLTNVCLKKDLAGGEITHGMCGEGRTLIQTSKWTEQKNNVLRFRGYNHQRRSLSLPRIIVPASSPIFWQVSMGYTLLLDRPPPCICSETLCHETRNNNGEKRQGKKGLCGACKIFFQAASNAILNKKEKACLFNHTRKTRKRKKWRKKNGSSQGFWGISY